jgi:hypothetical protein
MKSGLDLGQAEERLRQMVGGSSLSEEDFLPGMGLFEASHLACPVLPQYHPKQLMELLNSGKFLQVTEIFFCFIFLVITNRFNDRPGSSLFVITRYRTPTFSSMYTRVSVVEPQ